MIYPLCFASIDDVGVLITNETFDLVFVRTDAVKKLLLLNPAICAYLNESASVLLLWIELWRSNGKQIIASLLPTTDVSLNWACATFALLSVLQVLPIHARWCHGQPLNIDAKVDASLAFVLLPMSALILRWTIASNFSVVSLGLYYVHVGETGQWLPYLCELVLACLLKSSWHLRWGIYIFNFQVDFRLKGDLNILGWRLREVFATGRWFDISRQEVQLLGCFLSFHLCCNDNICFCP